MSKKEFKNQMSEVMNGAWSIFRITGDNFSGCLKKSWQLLKLKSLMKSSTVQFFYQKVSGEIRQAFGTLKDEVVNANIKGTGRIPNENLFTYFDTEKKEFRSFKKFNLIKIV